MSTNPPKKKFPHHANYRAILGEKAWLRLHPAIRKRFAENSKKISVTYSGKMNDVSSSFAGKILAQLCRIIGTPLALYSGKNIPCKVNVYYNKKLDGMTWDRYYYFPGNNLRGEKINRVKSTKCISPESGLIEVVGAGFGMQLKIYEQNGALYFYSTQFFWQWMNFRIRIPNFLTPGRTVVRQRALDNQNFEFSLDVNHPLLGKVFHQKGIFREE